MKYFFIKQEKESLELSLKAVFDKSNLQPFSPMILTFLKALSSEILLDKQLKKFPELLSVAHWMREGNIVKLKKEFEGMAKGQVILPVGAVLHFAPSNVDTIFIYSWVLSLLLGNKNIIRVSQKSSPLKNEFLTKLNLLLSREEFSPIATRLVILSYEHNVEISTLLSSFCDLRVIWGGDKTIANIRKSPLPARTTDIVFANRFSSAVVDSSFINRLDSDEMRNQAELFVKDTFVYMQNACSSPRAVFFVGNVEENEKARKKFWRALKPALKQVQEEQAERETSLAMIRLTSAFQSAAGGELEEVSDHFFDFPFKIQVKDLTPEMKFCHAGVGMFFEKSISSLVDLYQYLNKEDQTLISCGFSKKEWETFFSGIPNNAIDRVVPFGKALEFSHVWDGQNFLQSFSRLVTIDNNI